MLFCKIIKRGGRGTGNNTLEKKSTLSVRIKSIKLLVWVSELVAENKRGKGKKQTKTKTSRTTLKTTVFHYCFKIIFETNNVYCCFEMMIKSIKMKKKDVLHPSLGSSSLPFDTFESAKKLENGSRAKDDPGEMFKTKKKMIGGGAGSGWRQIRGFGCKNAAAKGSRLERILVQRSRLVRWRFLVQSFGSGLRDNDWSNVYFNGILKNP